MGDTCPPLQKEKTQQKKKPTKTQPTPLPKKTPPIAKWNVKSLGNQVSFTQTKEKEEPEL